MQDLASDFSIPSLTHPTPSLAFGRARGASAPVETQTLVPLNFSTVVAPLSDPQTKLYSHQTEGMHNQWGLTPELPDNFVVGLSLADSICLVAHCANLRQCRFALNHVVGRENGGPMWHL